MVHDRALALVSPIVALAFAILGCLLGTILATRARGSRGAPKARLITYATLAIAVVGIWQPAVVDIAGRRLVDAVITLELLPLAEALGVALVAGAAAVILCAVGTPGRLRWLIAALLLAMGVGGCQYLVLDSVNASGGELGYDLPMVAGAAGFAGLAGLALARSMAATGVLRHAFLGVALVGVSITATHYAAALALVLRPNSGLMPPSSVAGLDPMRVEVLTALAGAVLIALLWFFSFGTATRRDLRVTFSPEPESAELEDWMRKQRAVTAAAQARAAEEPALTETDGIETYGLGATSTPGSPAPLPGRRPLAPRPTPGITPAWRAMPVWGRPAPSEGGTTARPAAAAAAQAATAANSARTRARDWAQRDSADRPGERTNSRDWSAPAGRPEPRPRTEVPATAGGYGDEEPSIVRSTTSSPPLPRRNARP